MEDVMFLGRRTTKIGLSDEDLAAAAAAIKSKGFKIGIRVTNGDVVGYIEFIDPKTFDVSINTSLRTMSVSPLVLECF